MNSLIGSSARQIGGYQSAGLPATVGGTRLLAPISRYHGSFPANPTMRAAKLAGSSSAVTFLRSGISELFINPASAGDL